MANYDLSTTFGSLLNDEEYAEFHILRKNASTMDQLQREKFDSIISSQFPENKRFSILSVGSGTGDFDKDLVQSIASKIDRYVCIEPLKEHLAPLRSNLLQVLQEDQIEIHHGVAEDFSTTQKFDLIHNVHVIHWTKEPVSVLKKLQTFLTPNGISITVLQSENGMPRLYSRLKPETTGSLTAEKLFKDMSEAHMEGYRIDYVPAQLDATQIVNGTDLGKKILQFIVSSKLNTNQFEKAIPIVKSLGTTVNEKTIILEPFAFITNGYAIGQ